MIKSNGLLIILFIFSSFLSFTSQTFANQEGLSEKSILKKQQTILILGDSLSAAYGIPIESSWAHLLKNTLVQHNAATGSRYNLINASISGETTDGGLRALPGLLSKYQPAIVMIELGANDGLRGFPLTTIKKNLSALIESSQTKQAKVLLMGMHIPPNYGKRYADAFHNIFLSLAKHYNTALVPFLLDGIAIEPSLMQADGLHPTAQAQVTIKNKVWKQLKLLL